jgi:MoaA/NifB/PqqE/SkfB family radical SAM enzyme
MGSVKQMKELGISMRFNTIFTPENISEYKKIADISKEMSIPLKPTTYTYPSVRIGSGNKDSRFSPEEAAEYISLIDEYRLDKEFYLERARKLLSLPKGPTENKVRCRAGKSSYWITANGIMRPCGMMPEPDARPFEDGFEKADLIRQRLVLASQSFGIEFTDPIYYLIVKYPHDVPFRPIGTKRRKL